jgi:hypothetical protein
MPGQLAAAVVPKAHCCGWTGIKIRDDGRKKKKKIDDPRARLLP